MGEFIDLGFAEQFAQGGDSRLVASVELTLFGSGLDRHGSELPDSEILVSLSDSDLLEDDGAWRCELDESAYHDQQGRECEQSERRQNEVDDPFESQWSLPNYDGILVLLAEPSFIIVLTGSSMALVVGYHQINELSAKGNAGLESICPKNHHWRT